MSTSDIALNTFKTESTFPGPLSSFSSSPYPRTACRQACARSAVTLAFFVIPLARFEKCNTFASNAHFSFARILFNILSFSSSFLSNITTGSTRLKSDSNETSFSSSLLLFFLLLFSSSASSSFTSESSDFDDVFFLLNSFFVSFSFSFLCFFFSFRRRFSPRFSFSSSSLHSSSFSFAAVVVCCLCCAFNILAIAAKPPLSFSCSVVRILSVLLWLCVM
mmetsp:Transcript_554/g.1748  ORF Transcript_554/g.1748 Transcript_554/m.1748 type:complete len:220 (-) Transcript_554:42-701(-)